MVSVPQPYAIRTPQLRRALASVQEEVGSKTRLASRLIGDGAVSELRSPSASLVNVDTGRMRRGFRFRVRGAGPIEILNTARSPKGFPYARVVEERYGGAARTVRKRKQSIARAAERGLQRHADRNPGRFPGEVG